MKRSGFMKRKTPLVAKKGFKWGIPPKTKLKPARARISSQKRSKLPTVKKMRNKCDKMLTPIIKLLYPTCLLRQAKSCNIQTQVSHHYILKSKCTALRYELKNLIPLCNPCHLLLHTHESYYSSIIMSKKGLEWFESLKSQKEKIIKADIHFYIENYKRLRNILDKIEPF